MEEEKQAKLQDYRVKTVERSVRRDCAELAYYYPIYTLEDAMELPVGDQKLLLTFARMRRAEDALQQLNLQAAAQSAKGFRKLTNNLKEVIKQLGGEL